MPARKRVTKPTPDAPAPEAGTVTTGGWVYEVRRAFPVLCTDGKVRFVKPFLAPRLPELLTTTQLDEFTTAGLLSRRPATHATEG